MRQWREEGHESRGPRLVFALHCLLVSDGEVCTAGQHLPVFAVQVLAIEVEYGQTRGGQLVEILHVGVRGRMLGAGCSCALSRHAGVPFTTGVAALASSQSWRDIIPRYPLEARTKQPEDLTCWCPDTRAGFCPGRMCLDSTVDSGVLRTDSAASCE